MMCSARSFSEPCSSSAIRCSSSASRPRQRYAGDRMRFDDAFLDADQHLRRRADDVHVA